MIPDHQSSRLRCTTHQALHLTMQLFLPLLPIKTRGEYVFVTRMQGLLAKIMVLDMSDLRTNNYGNIAHNVTLNIMFPDALASHILAQLLIDTQLQRNSIKNTGSVL